MITRAGLAVLVLTVLGQPALAANKAQIAEGEIIATDACTACHKVGHYQARPRPVYDEIDQADVRAPTFMEIAKKHGDDPQYLRRAITMPKHPMREQDWNEKDLKAVIAYLQSLKGQKPLKKPLPH